MEASWEHWFNVAISGMVFRVTYVLLLWLPASVQKGEFTRTSSTYWPFIPTAIALLRTSSPAVAPAIINLFLFLSVNKTTKEEAINFLASLAEQPKAQQRVPSDVEQRGSGAFYKRRNQEGTNCQSNEGRFSLFRVVFIPCLKGDLVIH